VLRVVDTDHVYVDAWIDETALPMIREGQPARIVLPGRAAPVAGIVRRIGWEADRQTHELRVEVAPTAPLGRVAIGQRADVWITTETKASVLRVPLDYLRQGDGGPTCAVDRGGRIAVVPVHLGAVGHDDVEIVDGLRAGDTVLAPPTATGSLTDGRRWRGGDPDGCAGGAGCSPVGSHTP
jgi:HlyD family secretion protein